MKKAHKIQIFKKSDKMKQNISQKVDSGRSMVEMLGVLAVIGVLSVASILGYRYAMAKWRANETVNELNIRAYDIATRFDKLVAANTTDIEMEMGNTTKLGYPITARISPQYEDYFEMFVSNVPTDVCKELLNSQWQAPYSIFVGIEEYEASSDICEQAENVQLAYEFYKDLSDRDEIPEEVQHKIQRCNHKNNCQCGTCNEEIGLCESECEKDQLCLKRYDDPQWMKCCDKENKVGDYCCAYVEDGKCCNYNSKCCPPEKPLMDKDGKCYTCDEENPVNQKNMSIKNCSTICSNRILSGEKNNYCALPCSTDKPLIDNTGKCHACTEDKLITVSNNCEKNCPNRVLANKKYSNLCALPCPADKPLMDFYGKCHSCDEDADIDNDSVTSRCSSVCPNRVIKEPYYCIKNKCSGDTPLVDKDGNCQACDYPDSVLFQSNPNCTTLCPDRKKSDINANYCAIDCPTTHPLHDNTGGCHTCTEDKVITPVNNCEKTCPNRILTNNKRGTCNLPCPADKPLMDFYGKCHSCDEDADIDNDSVTSRCSSVCPNRVIKEPYYCVKNKCSGDTPLVDKDGNCQACDYPDSVLFQSNPNCTTLCPDRKKSDINANYCAIDCPTTHPLRDNTGGCHTCTEDKVITPVNNCEKTCPNRILTNNKRGTCNLPCPAEKPLMDFYGKCHSCNENAQIDNDSVTSRCSNVCTNRVIEAPYYCVREKCLAGYFEDTTGECYACDITTSLAVKDEAACKVCMNRKYQDGLCVENTSGK